MTKTLAAFALVIVLFLPAEKSVADIYTWVDKDGVSHISDTKPPPGYDVEIIITPQSLPPAPRPAAEKPETIPNPMPKRTVSEKLDNKAPSSRRYANTVEIFTTSWCGYCKNAIDFLRSNGIAFQQYDIEKDPDAAARMHALGGTGGVPFAIINGNPVLGFSPKTYQQALGLR